MDDGLPGLDRSHILPVYVTLKKKFIGYQYITREKFKQLTIKYIIGLANHVDE